MTIVKTGKKHFGAVAIGMVLAAASLGVAVAEEAGERCPYQAPLLALADVVLTERWDLPPIQVRSYGSEAAFLKIRYGGMTDVATEAMLDQLVEARARFAPDLRLAWYIAHLGPESVEALGSEALDILGTTAGISAIRAQMLTGHDDAILDRFTGMPGDAQYDLMMAMVTAVIDKPDAYKALIAEHAQARGLLSLAVAMTATMHDRSAWKKFATTVDDKVELDAWTRSLRWLPAMVGNPVLPFREDGLTAEMRANRARLHDILIAAALQPEAEFLNLFFNTTGDIDTTLAVANDLRTEIETFGMSPVGTLDQGWLLAFRGLSEKFGAERVRSLLNTSSNAGRYGQLTISDVIDRIIAIQGLTPLVTGADGTAVTMPADLSEADRARWPHLVELVARVRTNANDPALAADAEDFSVIADLLFARMDMDALASFVAAAPASPATVATAADYAQRLDRLCNSYLWHPAEAVLLSGQPIYKFD